jgi:hypothetical protein
VLSRLCGSPKALKIRYSMPLCFGSRLTLTATRIALHGPAAAKNLTPPDGGKDHRAHRGGRKSGLQEPHTIRAYGEDLAAFTGKGSRSTCLSDLQRYADAVVGAPATRSRRLRSLKSLLSFASKMG